MPMDKEKVCPSVRAMDKKKVCPSAGSSICGIVHLRDRTAPPDAQTKGLSIYLCQRSVHLSVPDLLVKILTHWLPCQGVLAISDPRLRRRQLRTR
jgi:hypothetical protein